MKNQRQLALRNKPKAHSAAERARLNLKAHPVRFGLRFFILAGFLYVIFTQMAARGYASPVLLTCACIYVALLIFRLCRHETKADEVREWALEEQEHITMMSLTGKNQDELQKLLDYHMKYGNIEEADRISQKLLAVVDKGTFEDPQDAAASAVAQTTVQATGSGLPSWMKDGTEPEAEAEAKPDPDSKLPDWMKQS